MGGAPMSPIMVSRPAMYGSTGMGVLLGVVVGEGKGPGLAVTPGSAVGEGPVVEVGLGQDVPLLEVLQEVDPRLPVALLEQDVLRSHDVAGAEVLRVTERAPLHPGVLRPQGR